MLLVLESQWLHSIHPTITSLGYPTCVFVVDAEMNVSVCGRAEIKTKIQQNGTSGVHVFFDEIAITPGKGFQWDAQQLRSQIMGA